MGRQSVVAAFRQVGDKKLRRCMFSLEACRVFAKAFVGYPPQKTCLLRATHAHAHSETLHRVRTA